MIRTSLRAAAAAVLGSLIVFALSCGGGSSTSPSNKDGAPSGPTPGGATVGKPDFSLTAKELADEFNKDNKAAAAKYKGKVV